ncbi:MAG: response regulator [Bryobacteraceae bacterium]
MPELSVADPPILDSMQELQRTHAKMLAALNHEIRTPLTGILGMSDLLLESSLSAEQREYVQSTRLCAESLLESLCNALEYATVMAGELHLSDSPFHLHEVIRASVAAMQARAEARGLLIQLLAEPAETNSPEVVAGDAVRLRQVVGILLSHAINACLQDEITVAVSTFSMEPERRLILTVSVGDNGPDLQPSKLRQLFAPPETGGYTQARLELGLPLAFQLVQAMGGRLEAESVGGAGTFLTVTLPLRVSETHVDVGARPAVVLPLRPQILLVEDNDVAQRFMRTVLERKGYDVCVAPSGVAAIEAVAAAPFDLILMDVQMPEMDGLECTRRVRLLPGGRSVPIVACTANTAYEVRSSCMEAGMDDFLSKPVHIAELVEIVAKYLAVGQPGAMR